MLRTLASSPRLLRAARQSAQFSSSTGRWSAAQASASSSPAQPTRRTRNPTPPPASPADEPPLAPSESDPAPSPAPAPAPKAPAARPDRPPSESRAFFVDRARKKHAARELQRAADLILVPVATSKEVQYDTAEEFEEAREAEVKLKQGRIERAARLFDEGKLPEELRSLVGGRPKPFALSTVRRYLLDRAADPTAADFRELLALNWARFTLGGGEYADAPDLEAALRRVRVERGEETEYKPRRTKPKADKWQRK